MSRRALVKVCGMRDPDNIRDVAGLKPDFLGFIFVPESPRSVGKEARIAQVMQAVPRDVTKVGVFRDTQRSEVIRAVEQFGLGVVQLHGSEDAEYIIALKRGLSSSVKIWKSVSVTENVIEAIASAPRGADVLLLDGPRPGSGQRFNWLPLLEDVGIDRPFMVAGGVGVESIEEARRLFEMQPQCIGVDINSRVEIAPGLKDIDQVKRCIEGMTL